MSGAAGIPAVHGGEEVKPRGATNIRDALFEGRDQIESLPTRA